MSALEEAEKAMAYFKETMDQGAPWVPGVTFINNPGLAGHVLMAFGDYVRVQRAAEQSKPARRESLSGGDGDVLPDEEVLRS